MAYKAKNLPHDGTVFPLMLSKEHLRYGLKGSDCVPYFLKSTAHWETLAQDLLTVSLQSRGQSYEELQEQWLACEAASGRYRKAAKGLRSMIESKVELEQVDEAVLASARKDAWQAQVSLLRQAPSLPPFPEQSQNLYADLEPRRKVVAVPLWSPSQLLQRYNLALLQGIMLHAERIKCELQGASPRALRYFWRYLKFFGLLVRVEHIDAGKSAHFYIEGPLLEQGASQRYRMRMAAIVGVMPNFDQWKLRADICIDQQRSHLVIDQSEGLRSHYQPFYDYIPEELKVFTQSLHAELKGWISKEPIWPSKPLQEWDLPDLCFENPQGQRVSIFIYFAQQKDAYARHSVKAKIDSACERQIILAERGLLTSVDTVIEVIPFSAMPSSKALMKKLKEWGWF